MSEGDYRKITVSSLGAVADAGDNPRGAVEP
jgi:hypothetical protein